MAIIDESVLPLRDSRPRLAPHAHEVEAVLDPAIVVTGNGRIATLNQAASLLAGYEHEELIGCPIKLLLAPRTVRDLHVDHGKSTLRTKDGHNIPVELLQCPGNDGTRVIVFRPVEAQRGYLREETIAGIVHDLKVPLSTIGLELGELGTRLGASEAAAEALARVELNVMFMDRMIHDLLDAASIDDGHFAMHFHTTELRSLLSEVVGRVVSTRDRARVKVNASETILASIDDNRIERVLANLVANAIRYSPADSEIDVRLERAGAMARVSVTDFGPGLTADEATYVFDKYRRAATAARHDGVGLGLYVCRKIVEQHGGRIGVETAPRRGSRFYFEIPLL